jgi:hypothetical protein
MRTLPTRWQESRTRQWMRTSGSLARGQYTGRLPPASMLSLPCTPSKDHPRLSMNATIRLESPASRGLAGIGALNGERGPYGRQHADGQ